MADFHTHVTFSSAIGGGYAAFGFVALGLPLETALLGGGLCGVSGMLPDIDSDSGIPLRETMAFSAAVVPMLLVDRFRDLQLQHDQMVLIGASLYFLIRFGLIKLIARLSVHRGMFHSIPAGLVFAGVAFLISGTHELPLRYYKAGGVFLGFLSHLLLDEFYSVEWTRARLKKSSGTALKWWGKNAAANLTVYAALIVVAGLIFSDPTVRQRIELQAPELISRYDEFRDRLDLPLPYRGETDGRLGELFRTPPAQPDGAGLASPVPPASQPGMPTGGAPLYDAHRGWPPRRTE